MGGRESIISMDNITLILTAMIMGTLARILVLKEDYRQYPSYPNGYMIHILIGFIAATLGAVFVPALMTSNWTAVTFLSLAIQQFRDVRKTEKESLKELENTEFTPRGDAYIDGIAKTFESRNYFALVVSICTAASMQIYKPQMRILDIALGVIVGFVVLMVLKRFSKGKQVGDIAIVQEGKIEVKDSELFVDGIFVSNLVGTDNAQKMLTKEGLAVTILPKEDHFRITLDNFGQRKAILFEATRTVGVKRYHYTRKDFESGKTIIVIVPLVRDMKKLIYSIKNTPLLESVKKSHALMDTGVGSKE
ncbi:YIEGIA domain-containing protein [Paenibacillus chondroitinus]|uniref:YIEGIA domain-containing protein n=1 Tax=Paenibacillus chondroitinus TaxID=59842 RepID=A0ABU6DL75_9BACL|nr:MULTISPECIES: YIEGIA domain-containing protein [Paenibacillus]MCY9657131.1 YIEGIA family protein [Paenibacillus anseongense]MEB4798414.1 YIEGIA domain-containing protein [Paenibacillus chondroitinus]